MRLATAATSLTGLCLILAAVLLFPPTAPALDDEHGAIEMVNSSNSNVSFIVTCKLKGVCYSKVLNPGARDIYVPAAEEFIPVEITAQRARDGVPWGPPTTCEYKPLRRNIVIATPRTKPGDARGEMLVKCIWRTE